MRALIVHNLYQIPGGEDTVADNEAALLEAHGHEVRRWTVDNDEINASAGAAAKARLAVNTVWSRPAYVEMRRRLRDWRPDVAHFHNTFPLLSPSVYAACRDERVPVVQTLHNYRLLCPRADFYRDGHVCEDCMGKLYPYPGVVHSCYRGSKAQSAVVASMLAYNRARGSYRNLVDTYVVLSEFGREKFVQGGLPADRLTVKPNFLPEDPGEGSHQGAFALYAGRLFDNKGARTLIAAWKRLPEAVPLVVAGSGPLEAELRAAATGLPHVRFLGQVDRGEVGRLMGEASFVVFPTEWYEGFSMVPIEAMGRGTPVIGSRIGSVPDAVREGVNGWLVPPGDAGALAEAVTRAWSDPGEVRRLGAGARDVFLREYTGDANYPLLMGAYEHAARNAARA